MKQSKEQKRMDAEARQKNYDKLSVEEKLERIEMRPGESRRERNRLEKGKNNE